MEQYVSVREAARIKKVTRQAIYLAIRLKKLRAYKYGDRFRIFRVDLDDYDSKRYSREMTTYKGEPIYDDSKGVMSIDKAAKMLGIPTQKVYYAARTGKLKAMRKGSCWVVYVEDLFRYQDDYLKSNFTHRAVS